MHSGMVPSEVGYVSITAAQCCVDNEKKQNSFSNKLSVFWLFFYTKTIKQENTTQTPQTYKHKTHHMEHILLVFPYFHIV